MRTDTLSIGDAWNVTLSARYNRTGISNIDRLQSGRRPGSLDGDYTLQPLESSRRRHVQPVTRRQSSTSGYSEGSRAPTSIELGCADPERSRASCRTRWPAIRR